MTSKHTPGPWHINTLEKVPASIHSARGHVADVSRGTMLELSPDEIEANARLIVSAPELLEALQQAESAMLSARIEAGKVDDSNEDRRTTGGRKLFPCNQAVVHATGEALTQIRSAIAKAKGQA